MLLLRQQPNSAGLIAYEKEAMEIVQQTRDPEFRLHLGSKAQHLIPLLRELGDRSTSDTQAWYKAIAATYRLCRNAAAGNSEAQDSLITAGLIDVLTPQLKLLLHGAKAEQDSRAAQVNDRKKDMSPFFPFFPFFSSSSLTTAGG